MKRPIVEAMVHALYDDRYMWVISDNQLVSR
jgi:hypothetical protein